MTKTTTPINIVFLDGYTLNPGDTEWTLFEQFGNFTAYDRTRPEDIVQRAREADILIVNKTRLTAEHFDRLSRLRLVCVAADTTWSTSAQPVRTASQSATLPDTVPKALPS